MCRVLGVSPSGFYAWRSRPESARSILDHELGQRLCEFHALSRGIYGSPRLHDDLIEAGFNVSRKRVIRLMQEHGLRGRRRRAFVITTQAAPVVAAPNMLGRNFSSLRPDTRWVGDVTALKTSTGWLYLAVLIDLFSRRIVGWALSRFNDRLLVLHALRQAVASRRPQPGLVQHTDRGSPYASEDYQAELGRHGIACSMSRKGNCYDNAVAESWFRTLKVELGDRFADEADARTRLFDYIEVFYNRRRKHSALGYLSPERLERAFEKYAA
jgi:transposase InsO family protein